MRMVLTKGGIPTIVSIEEFEFLESIDEVMPKNELTERQAEIAKILTSKGILSRNKDDQTGINFTKYKG